MKKLLVLFLVLFCLYGCEQNDPSNENENNPASIEEAINDWYNSCNGMDNGVAFLLPGTKMSSGVKNQFQTASDGVVKDTSYKWVTYSFNVTNPPPQTPEYTGGTIITHTFDNWVYDDPDVGWEY